MQNNHAFGDFSFNLLSNLFGFLFSFSFIHHLMIDLLAIVLCSFTLELFFRFWYINIRNDLIIILEIMFISSMLFVRSTAATFRHINVYFFNNCSIILDWTMRWIFNVFRYSCIIVRDPNIWSFNEILFPPNSARLSRNFTIFFTVSWFSSFMLLIAMLINAILKHLLSTFTTEYFWFAILELSC